MIRSCYLWEERFLTVRSFYYCALVFWFMRFVICSPNNDEPTTTIPSELNSYIFSPVLRIMSFVLPIVFSDFKLKTQNYFVFSIGTLKATLETFFYDRTVVFIHCFFIERYAILFTAKKHSYCHGYTRFSLPERLFPKTF